MTLSVRKRFVFVFFQKTSLSLSQSTCQLKCLFYSRTLFVKRKKKKSFENAYLFALTV